MKYPVRTILTLGKVKRSQKDCTQPRNLESSIQAKEFNIDKSLIKDEWRVAHVVILLLLAVCLMTTPSQSASNNSELTTQIVNDVKKFVKNKGVKFYTSWAAHRGVSGFAPENSVPAFRIAARLGAKLIETDVRMTEDGVMICSHNATTTKLNGLKGHVYDHTYDEITANPIYDDFVTYKGKSFTGLKIPTFNQYLDVIGAYDKPIAKIHVKKRGSNQDVDEYAQEIYDTIVKHGLENRCYVTSDYYDELYAFAKCVQRGMKKGGKAIKIWYSGKSDENRKSLRKNVSNTKIYPKANAYVYTFSDYPIVIKSGKKCDVMVGKNNKLTMQVK